MTSTEGDLTAALEMFRGAQLGIRSVTLSSSQGRTLASTQLTGMEKVRLAASSAAALAIATKVVGDHQLGSLRQVQVLADEGSVLLLNVGAKAVLAVLLEPNASVGPIATEARRVADRLAVMI